MVAPNSINSATVFPSLAPSNTSYVISAVASGWFNFNPLSFRLLARSAVTTIMSLSISRGNKCIVMPPFHLFETQMKNTPQKNIEDAKIGYFYHLDKEQITFLVK